MFLILCHHKTDVTSACHTEAKEKYEKHMGSWNIQLNDSSWIHCSHGCLKSEFIALRQVSFQEMGFATPVKSTKRRDDFLYFLGGSNMEKITGRPPYRGDNLHDFSALSPSIWRGFHHEGILVSLRPTRPGDPGMSCKGLHVSQVACELLLSKMLLLKWS